MFLITHCDCSYSCKGLHQCIFYQYNFLGTIYGPGMGTGYQLDVSIFFKNLLKKKIKANKIDFEIYERQIYLH